MCWVCDHCGYAWVQKEGYVGLPEYCRNVNCRTKHWNDKTVEIKRIAISNRKGIRNYKKESYDKPW